jgi:hypothetical protein
VHNRVPVGTELYWYDTTKLLDISYEINASAAVPCATGAGATGADGPTVEVNLSGLVQ